MKDLKTISIRTFIGAKDYKQSRMFYTELGFEEFVIGANMSYFKIDEDLGFYLQDYYVKDWVDNSMVFLEVEDLDKWQAYLGATISSMSYPSVRISEIQNEEWGRELFVHDPSGILWHFGEFVRD